MSDKHSFTPKLSKRLTFKLSRNVVLVSLLTGLLMSTFIAYRDLISTRDFFIDTVKQVIQTANQPAARAAYNLNTELAGEVADGLMEYKSIISVTINDDLQNTLTSKFQTLESSPYRWLAEDAFGGLQNFEIELHTIDDPEVKAGYLQIIVDPIKISEEFIDRTFSEFIFNILRSLIVAAILSLVFYRLLVRPVQNIALSLANTDPDNPEDTCLSVPRGNLGDELSILADSGNRLLNSISKRVGERDVAEEELKKAAETLELRIKERTAELAEQFEAAQAATKSKQEFLASMSHEIRTPMSGVMGLADMLLDDDISPDTREKVEKIKGATQSLLVIINDILDLSKIDSGKLELENIDYHFRSEVGKTVEIIERSAEEKLLDLIVNISDEIPAGLHGDPTRIRQILINLLGNAVKFTAKGSVSLQVEQQIIRTDNLEMPWLIFRVNDTGIGIAANIIDDLFNDFTQADASITRRYEGTGLGLAISKRLVEHMGGEISVTSTEGKGATFEARLPLVPAKNGVDLNSHPDQPIAYETLHPLTILAVDDNQLNRRIVQAIAEKNGHKVILAENGKEAVNKLVEATSNPHSDHNILPDLVLMDVRMPEMSGPEATMVIRAMKGDISQIPIIALTADAMENHVKEYYEVGMNSFVSKPIDPFKLLQTINQVMGKEIHKPLQTPINQGNNAASPQSRN